MSQRRPALGSQDCTASTLAHLTRAVGKIDCKNSSRKRNAVSPMFTGARRFRNGKCALAGWANEGRRASRQPYRKCSQPTCLLAAKKPRSPLAIDTRAQALHGRISSSRSNRTIRCGLLSQQALFSIRFPGIKRPFPPTRRIVANVF